MVLGLLPEGYVVYYIYGYGSPNIASINNSLLFFTSYNAAKQAAEDYIASFTDLESTPLPDHIWIEPIQKLWINGQD